MFRGIHYCSVPTCGNNDFRSQADTFHYLPAVDSVRITWIKKCYLRCKWEILGIEPLFCDSATVVCSQHFSDDDYLDLVKSRTSTGSYRILKPDAIPSLCLPTEDFLKSLGKPQCISGKIAAQKIAAELQLEKLSSGAVYTGTMQDYRTALLESCTFADIEGKCHTCIKLHYMPFDKWGLLIPSDGDKRRLSWKTGIPSDAIQNMCYYHEFGILRQQSKCCDPLQKHKSEQRKAIYRKDHRVVTPFVFDKIKHFAPHALPGEAICKRCVTDVRYNLPKVLQRENTAISSQSTLNSESKVQGLEDSTAEATVRGCMKIQPEFVCDSCGLVLANEVSLVEHLVVVHLKELTLPRSCEFCNKTFDVRIIYNKHVMLHKKEMLEQGIAARKSAFRERKQEIFVCLVCHQKFKLRSDLNLHKEVCRPGRELSRREKKQSEAYFCCVCLQEFSSALDVNAHEKSCKRSRQNTHELVEHKHCGTACSTGTSGMHAQSVPFSCNFCYLTFCSGENLQEHLTLFHSGSTLSNYRLLFKCNVCRKNFSSRAYLKSHLKLHTNSESTITREINNGIHEQSDGATRFKCNICSSKFFEQEIDFEVHLLEVHTSVSASSYLELAPLSLSCRNGGRSCVLCGCIFSKPDLFKHLAESHAVTKLFPCKICGRRFNSANDSLHHDVEDHKGYRSRFLHCEFCKKQLSSQNTDFLVQHNHSHKGTNSAKFFCSLCGAAFRLSRKLLLHHVLQHVPHDLPNQPRPARFTEPCTGIMNVPFLHNILDVYIS